VDNHGEEKVEWQRLYEVAVLETNPALAFGERTGGLLRKGRRRHRSHQRIRLGFDRNEMRQESLYTSEPTAPSLNRCSAKGPGRTLTCQVNDYIRHSSTKTILE
jgi:hypothetical protein